MDNHPTVQDLDAAIIEYREYRQRLKSRVGMSAVIALVTGVLAVGLSPWLRGQLRLPVLGTLVLAWVVATAGLGVLAVLFANASAELRKAERFRAQRKAT